MTINEKIGKRLRAIRNKKGISAAHLAETSGVSDTYITAVERGEMNITINKLKAITDALDCNLDVVINQK